MFSLLLIAAVILTPLAISLLMEHRDDILDFVGLLPESTVFAISYGPAPVLTIGHPVLLHPTVSPRPGLIDVMTDDRLPEGLALNGDGSISGVPTGNGGTNVLLKARRDRETAETLITLRVYAPVRILPLRTTIMPGHQKGWVRVDGGDGATSLSFIEAPDGLEINRFGEMTASESLAPGSYPVVVRAEDGRGRTGITEFEVVVAKPTDADG